MDSQSSTSTSTLVGDGPPIAHLQPHHSLDLSDLPPIFVLSAHMDTNELHDLEDQLREGGAPLTYDAHEARVFLGCIAQKRRAVLELRGRGVWSEEVGVLEGGEGEDGGGDSDGDDGSPARKKRRVGAVDGGVRGKTSVEDSSTDSESEVTGRGRVPVALVAEKGSSLVNGVSTKTRFRVPGDEDVVHIIKLAWFRDSVEAQMLLPLKNYAIYTGRKTGNPHTATKTQHFPKPPAPAIALPTTEPAPKATTMEGENILKRALAELAPRDQDTPARSFASTSQLTKRAVHPPHRIAHLVHQSTSEHDLGHSADLPDPPDWVKRGSVFSCERSTPLNGPNDAFVAELKKIRLARTLTADEIGVRAYSTAIAAVAAYPYTLTDQREILALPGCETKIAALWVEWKNNAGFVKAAHDAENDNHLKVLRFFWEIWGVGPNTARDFYNKGWRDLDDIVEFGWDTLSRVQQIGVKFYDEFLLKIPRAEVESIGAKIHEHAQRVREPSGVRSCIVGGYRRGKTESGDVDIIVSHLDENATLDIVEDIVKSLFDEGWITHELSTSLSGTRRSQSTLPYRSGGGGHGFDTLDKALVVWQDPRFPGRGQPGAKNPNPHRRVDIIISPWSKVGCGVLGWTAGTTFERDLRRYARKVKGWKFDSSGVRDRGTGEEVDLEGVGGRCASVEEAERKVFEGFGLVWREPWERNTW